MTPVIFLVHYLFREKTLNLRHSVPSSFLNPWVSSLLHDISLLDREHNNVLTRLPSSVLYVIPSFSVLRSHHTNPSLSGGCPTNDTKSRKILISKTGTRKTGIWIRLSIRRVVFLPHVLRSVVTSSRLRSLMSDSCTFCLSVSYKGPTTMSQLFVLRHGEHMVRLSRYLVWVFQEGSSSHVRYFLK